jgi:hypothetical protein
MDHRDEIEDDFPRMIYERDDEQHPPSLELVISDLEHGGISVGGDIRWLIHYLIKMGENPGQVLRRVIDHLVCIGGDVARTLNEIAYGVMTCGLNEFLKLKAEQALAPLKLLLWQIVERGQAISSLHTKTLLVLQRQLIISTTLDQSPEPDEGRARQQKRSETLKKLSTKVAGLNAHLDMRGEQAQLNRALAQGLDLIGVVIAGMNIEEILLAIASSIAVISTLGATDIQVASSLNVRMLAVQLERLLSCIAADSTLWLLGAIALYTQSLASPPGNENSAE